MDKLNFPFEKKKLLCIQPITITKFTLQFAQWEAIIRTLAKYLNSPSSRSFVHHNNSLFQSELDNVYSLSHKLWYMRLVLHEHASRDTPKTSEITAGAGCVCTSTSTQFGFNLDLYVIIQDSKNVGGTFWLVIVASHLGFKMAVIFNPGYVCTKYQFQ